MATTSMIFIISLKKANLFGLAPNLTMSSELNQMIHAVSMTKNGSVNLGMSSSSVNRGEGRGQGRY